MTKLCPRGKAAAKRKFKVYPSAYANAYASKICAGKIKDPSGVKRKDFRGSKAEGGLMEATSRLKRQGLKEGNKVKGKKRFKSIKEIEDYTKQAIDSLEGISDSLRDKNTPMKKQRLLDRTKPFIAKKKAIKESFQDKNQPMKKQRILDRVRKMGGGMINKPRAMYRKGGGVCLRGMNRDAIGKNS